MHDKYIIIDDQILLLGGRNTSGYFLGNSDGKHLSYDRDILVYNTAANTNSSKESVITQVRDYFYSVWNLKECTDEFNTIPFFKKEKIEQAKPHLDVYQGHSTLDFFPYLHYKKAHLLKSIPLYHALPHM
mgnify:CR=1 FL=1